MGPTTHALLSPSKGELILQCPPSIRLTQEMEDEKSSYAEEGTAAHALAEYKGRMTLGLPVGSRPVSDYDSSEMEEATDEYAQLLREKTEEIRARCRDPIIRFETRVSMGEYVPESYGTCDFLCVAEDELLIVDFKYGYQEISATENTQMKMYALGATLKYGALYDYDRVTMIICQPRIHNTSAWSLSLQELTDWAENRLKPAAELAYRGEGEYHPGPWCSKYYCKARAQCRARAESFLKLAKMEFRPAALLTDEELGQVLEQADELAKWAEEVLQYATAQAIEHDRHYEGWKLVRGRSVTRLDDEEAAARAARKAGYSEEQIYRKSLITLAELKKLMGKEQYEKLILPLTRKSSPKLTLRRETDRRQEVRRTVKDDFAD